MSIVHFLWVLYLLKLVLPNPVIIDYIFQKIMSSENNLEKSSQDYKKSQYGSWYKKSAENKKKIPDPKENSFLNKLKKIFFKK